MGIMSIFKNDTKDWITMYRKLSGSDMKGNIANRLIIEYLYAMLCVDTSSKECKISVPDIAIPVIARELIDVFHTCKENYIDGEDVSYLSMDTLADALLIYLAMTGKDIKDVHSMSRYVLVQDILKVLDNEEEAGVH